MIHSVNVEKGKKHFHFSQSQVSLLCSHPSPVSSPAFSFLSSPAVCSSCGQVSPWDKREEANEKKLNYALANSDHLALLQAYKVLCCTYWIDLNHSTVYPLTMSSILTCRNTHSILKC